MFFQIIYIYSVLAASFFLSISSFRVLNPITNQPNGSYFQPYDKGFVGIYGDANNYQRERINEGAFETDDTELLYEGVSPRQACPGMVGPFSDGNYYCSAREFGYCDRRSGTCFCNVGYQGIDCSECQDSHFKIGAHCYPKVLCIDDCSGAGTCNYNNGTCSCLPHRTGSKCETQLCTIFSSLCLTCTESECLQCAGGYYLTGDSKVCSSCYDFDPRCAGCIKESGCTTCADSTLTSVRRSGYRSSDPELPDEENSREFSITLPFGTKSPESFAAAEYYYVVATEEDSLKSKAKTCSQGLRNDDSWDCSTYNQSHIVCGHYGVFTLLYPNYEISESAKFIRMYVQRTGGGYGNVTINYNIKHFSTNDSDLIATAFYTTSQQLVFNEGVVQRSFLITILDDNIIERDEIFQVVLETPEGGGSVGAQFRANVTIIDDDIYLTTPKLSYTLENTTSAVAGESFSVNIQAVTGIGVKQTMGGDKWISIIENNLNSWTSNSKIGYQRHSKRQMLEISDKGNGKYIATSSGIKEQGEYQLRTWHAFPNSIKGEYFYDAFFEQLAISRLDQNVNFTWGTGRLIPRSSDYISIRWSGAIFTNETGYYRFLVDADDHARLWIDGKLLLDHFHERSVNMEPSRKLYLWGKKLYEIVLEYREVTGSAYAKLFWSRPNHTFEIIPQENLYSLFEIDRSPILVTINSTATSANYTECYGNGLYAGTALHQSTFTICPRDEYGNLRDDADEFYLSTQIFSSTLELISDLGHNGAGAEIITPSLKYNNQTHCFEGFYTPELAGKYRLNVTFKSTPDDHANHVLGSPFSVKIEPDKAYAPLSNVFGLPNPLYAEAGFCYNFTVVLRDLSRNLLLKGGNDILVYSYRVNYYNETPSSQISENNVPSFRPSLSPSLRPSIRPTLNPTRSPTFSPTSPYQLAYITDKISDTAWHLNVVRNGIVTDLGNGNYSVEICPVIAGIHEIHILLNGKGISNQNYRILDKFHSITETLGLQSFQGSYVSNSPYPLVVVHTKASLITSTAHGAGLLSATTGVKASFLLTVRDPFDNVLRTSLHNPNISLQLDRSLSSSVEVWNYFNGSYLLEYTPTYSGVNLISVFINGFQIKESPFKVNTSDGVTRSTFSYAEGAGLYYGVTGTNSYFRLYSYDLDDNRKSGYSDIYVFNISGSNSLSGILQPCPNPRVLDHPICDPYDLRGGAYFGSFVPTKTGVITIEIFLKNISRSSFTEISNSPFTALIDPSGPKAENTDISGTLYDNVAGVATDINLHLRDYYGNLLIKGAREVELILYGVGVDWGTVQPFNNSQGLQNEYNYKGFFYHFPNYYGMVTDHNDGTYSINYNVDKAGKYVMRISVAEEGLNATYFNDTHFGHLSQNDDSSTKFILDRKGVNKSYGSSISWTGDIGGQENSLGGIYGNTYYGKFLSRTESNVNFSASRGIENYISLKLTNPTHYNMREHYWSARWKGMITPKFAEIYKFFIRKDDDSSVNLWVGGLGSETNQSFKGTLVINSTSNLDLIGYYHFFDLKYREFVLEYVHNTGDAALSLYWESFSTPFQIIPSSAFTHWRNASHYNTTIHPAPLCSHCSTAYGKSLHNAEVSIEQSFLVYARDSFNNLMQTGGHTPAMVAIGKNGVAFKGKVTDFGNSTYLIRYYPTQAGEFLMYVTIGKGIPNNFVGYPEEINRIRPLLISGSPFSLSINSTSLDSTKSFISGKGVFGGQAGELLTFMIHFRDVFYNPTTISNSSASQILVLFKKQSNGDLVQPKNLTFERFQHSIIVHYIMNIADHFHMYVNIASNELENVVALGGSPFRVIISPIAPKSELARVSGIGLRQATMNMSNVFEIQLFDQFSNPLLIGGNKFWTRLVGDSDFTSFDIKVTPECIDQLNGHYLCSYTPKFSGSHRLLLQLLEANYSHPGGNGLLAKYFHGMIHPNSQPNIIQIDSKVQLNSADGFIIPFSLDKTNVSSDFIRIRDIGQSVIWSGFLVAPRSDQFTFSADSNNLNVSVYLDDVLVFDNKRELQSIPVTLKQSSSYAIRVEASSMKREENDLVYLDLLWSTPTVRSHSISEFFLYPKASNIGVGSFPVTVFQ